MLFPPDIPFLASARAQNWVASAILGAAPGIYLAITGLGAGGGQANGALLSSIQNSLGNGVFGVCSFFVPLILRYCNVRWFLVIGPTGYAVYIAGLMYFQAQGEMVFPLVLSVYWGMGSSLVWVSTTYISMAYATRAQKGHFINNQWLGLASGSLVGAAVAFGANIHKSKAAGVSQGVLGAWLSIHIGAAIAAYIFILPSGRVKTKDGSVIPAGSMIMGDLTFMQTLREMAGTWVSAKVLLVALAMFSSDFWLVFVGSYNARNFSLRARSLNTLLYWAIQIPAAEALSRLLDRKGWTNRQRGAAGFCTLFVMVCASWFGYYLWQGLNIESASMKNEITVIDWADGAAYVKGLVVYLIFGLSYPTYHVVLVFYFSMLAAEGSRRMTYYSGIFKGLQGTGLCLAFGIQTMSPNYLTLGICYGAVAILSLIPLGYAFWRFLENVDPEPTAVADDIESDLNEDKDVPVTDVPVVEKV